MEDLNDSIDIEVYRQLNTSLSSFEGFTKSDLHNGTCNLSGELNSSLSSNDGFSQSFRVSNLDDVNASGSQVPSYLEYDISENESQNEVESNYNSDNLVTENESDDTSDPEDNDESDNNFDSSSSVDESEENIVSCNTDSDSDDTDSDSHDTDSDSVENRRESIDLDGVANKDGTPDELFELLNQPINWKSNNFNNIDIKHFRGTSEAKLPPNWDSANSQPLDYFQLYFNDDILTKIVKNSNIYHRHCVQI